MNSIEFGKRLRRTRMVNETTAEQLAQACNVSKAAVWHWEQGHLPHIDKLYSICIALGVSADFMLFGASSDAWPENLRKFSRRGAS